jgi:hypothetical protein
MVDEANEEHILVELARIEAKRERHEINAQRHADAERFARVIEATRAKIEVLQKDVARTREMMEKLAATNVDVEVLQSEMELVRPIKRIKELESIEAGNFSS